MNKNFARQTIKRMRNRILARAYGDWAVEDIRKKDDYWQFLVVENARIAAHYAILALGE